MPSPGPLHRRLHAATGFILLLLLPRFAHSATYPHRPGVVLYRLNDQTTPRQQAMLQRLMQRHHAGVAPRREERRAHETWVVPAGESETAVAQALLATGAVEFAELDTLVPAAAVPNDPLYGSQWHHPMIGTPQAWNSSTGATSVLVAVCDTGVDAAHPDLAANLSLPGYNVVDQTTNTSPIHPHGTAVAGCIGAVGNNGLGVSGVDWRIKILPVRITNNPNTAAWCSDMAEAIEWAAGNGAKVINLSYGTDSCPHTIESAARDARAAGAVVVLSAGNNGMRLANPDYPEAHTSVLVGATDSLDRLAAFSNYGPAVDMVAPGVSIYTTTQGGYTWMSGTSFSSPITAGVAALAFAVNPNASPDQVRSWLLATSKDLGASGVDDWYGHGRVDAATLVAAAQGLLGTIPVSGPIATPSDFDALRVFPNPWRVDTAPAPKMTFDGLTDGATVRIFTLAGQWVRTVTAVSNAAEWDLTNSVGDRVASGLYLYLATDALGHRARGQLAVIR